MRILLVGDSHGDTKFIQRMFGVAQTQKCQVIFQLGDFGYWEHTRAGIEFLDACSFYGEQYGKNLYFLDGNHENHPKLWETYKVEDESGFIIVRDNVFYANRGFVWEWEKLKFQSLGGAWSIDKDWRVKQEIIDGPQTLWWPTETITSEQAEIAASVGKIDILFSHDAPLYVDVPNILPLPGGIDNRRFLQSVVKANRPDLLVHGHYHVRYDTQINFPYDDNGEMNWHTTKVVGLASNLEPGHNYWQAWEVLDLEQFR